MFGRALQEGMRDEIRAALAEADPKAMKELLEKAAPFGAAIAVEVSALHRKLDGTFGAIRRDLSALARSNNYQEIATALVKYAEYCPEEVEPQVKSLQEHSDRVLETAQNTLLSLCSSTNPGQIEADLTRYESFGDELDAEKNAASDRLAELIKIATDDMLTMSKVEEPDVTAIEEMLVKFRDYPAQLDEPRKALAEKLSSLTKSIHDQFRTLMLSDDIAVVDEGLKSFGKVGSQFKDNMEDLRTHRKELVNHTRDRLRTAMTSDSPAEIDTVIKNSDVFGKEVVTERKALERRRQVIVREAIRHMQALSGGTDYAAATAGLKQYEDFASETTAYWSALQKHQDALLQRTKDKLRDVCAEKEPGPISAAMAAVGEFGELVAEEIKAAESALTEIFNAAKSKLEAATTDEVRDRTT